MSAESLTFAHMIELARHIEALLLENDCVVIPTLGGFVAHYTPASRHEEEGTFEPPTRCIAFNPQLRLNDGLLAQSYSSVYGISFPEANRRMERDVRALSRQLQETGQAELPGVGLLKCSIRNAYSFTPYNHLLTTPSLYGLESFAMSTLAAIGTRQQPGQALSQETSPQTTTMQADQPTGRNKLEASQEAGGQQTRGGHGITTTHSHDESQLQTGRSDASTPVIQEGSAQSQGSRSTQKSTDRRTHRSRHAALVPYLAHVAVVMLVVALFFLVSTPIDNASVVPSNCEANLHLGAFWQLMQQPLAQVPSLDEGPLQAEPHSPDRASTPQGDPEHTAAEPEENQRQAAPASDSASNPQISHATPQSDEVAPRAEETSAPQVAASEGETLRYHVIVASVSTPQEAQALAEHYLSQGYQQAHAIIGDGRNRVAILSYAKAADAYAVLPIVNEREGIDGVWVLHH